MSTVEELEAGALAVHEATPGYGEILFKRTKSFALTIIRLYSSLSKDTLSQTLGRQAMRSGTSVGAHYREAYRARSAAEFVSKLEGGLQELEETCYWHELMSESGVVEAEAVAPILDEAEELIRIFVASVKKAKEKRK
ncbi:MAG: four helix bundle protein [Armatimonadetes bacterium]|nr:four helix bundle protein [Armatimonadota bacterium]